MNVSFRPDVSVVQAHITADQSGPSQTQDNNHTTSSLTSSASKGFFATILGGITCAAKAVASFVTMIFKKVFCCFFGDSKEVKELKAQKETLVNFKTALEAFAKSKSKDDYAKAIDALPENMKKAVIAKFEVMIVSF